MISLLEIYNKAIPSFKSDKGTAHDYIRIYEQFLTPYRETNNNILEIGLYTGHSIQMFAEYFHNAKTIYGIDINDIQVITSFKDKIDIRIADATKEDTFADITNLDVVIDDGSHILEDQITTLKLLWPKLNNNGIYIIEDIQSPTQALSLFNRDEFLRALPGFFMDLRYSKERYDDYLFFAYKR